MQISGSLKRKAIDFYRENIDYYSDKYFKTDNITFFYDGLLRSNNDKALRDRQEALILNGIENTLSKASTKNINNALVAKELELIQNTPRNMSYALFECFYKLVINSKSSDDFKLKLYKFAKFREYLCFLDNFTQWELDIMINLFLRNLSYNPINVAQEEKRVFGLNNVSSLYQNVINLGKFMAPHRVHNLARDFKDYNCFREYIAIVYFALKSDERAELFRNWCNTDSDLSTQVVIDRAHISSVPESLISLVRRLDCQSELPF